MSRPIKVTGCVKAATGLSESDTEDFLAAFDRYVASGVSQEEAGTLAVADLRAQMDTERSELVSAIAKATGKPETEIGQLGPFKPKAQPKPEAPKKAADAILEMIEGADIQGIAERIYDGIRAVEPADLPVLLQEDRMIRLPVKMEERGEVEARMKKLRFRITDRAQETAEQGRVLVSAIYMLDTGTITDVGQQMGGGRKDQNPPPKAPADPDEKAVDAFLAELHLTKLIDPYSNPEQSFGAMMFKEAVASFLNRPLHYLSTLARQYKSFSSNKGDKKVLIESFNDPVLAKKLEEAAEKYMERIRLLHDTMAPHTKVVDAFAAVMTKYIETDADTQKDKYTPDGTELKLVSKIGRAHDFVNEVRKYAGLFGGDNEDSTDQTHRVVKKDADAPPRLDRIIRVGMKDHRGGKPIEDAEKDFKAAFNFRGVEFGNWVTQAERLENLNLSYDSLMDMADLSGISPKMIGIVGKLGLAIGARGKGGSAAAHYETGNKVINITKTKGDGTVGHEWLHALDDMLANAQTDYARGALARKLISGIKNRMQYRYDIEKAQDFLRSTLRGAADEKNRNTPPKEAVFAALKQPRYYSAAPVYDGSNDSTMFYKNAAQMDSGASEKYWSTAHEMLARGFETMLFDKSKGGSPYLVGPTRADGYMTKKNGYSGTPYPRGEERKQISDAFELFLSQIDGETLQIKPYKHQMRVEHVPGVGYVAINQHGISPTGRENAMLLWRKTEQEAKDDADASNGTEAVLDPESKDIGELNLKIIDFAKRVDEIMEEMGIIRWPEVKNGSMAESMFFHLRQGWWPKTKEDLRDYTLKAYRIESKDFDLLKLKQAEEDFEAALGRYAAQRVTDMRTQGLDDRGIYDELVKLYESQPKLETMTSTSSANQAYSTPIPISFIAGLLGRVKPSTKVLDPTGGNGLLMVAANPKNAILIELEPHRAQNLRLMEYGKVIEGDALAKIESDIRSQETDVVLANPPFGAVAKEINVDSWDGQTYGLMKIDHGIAARAMKSMADGGRAVIILGAQRSPGATTSTDRAFLNWLYSNYNVADHFEIDGKLYTRQGAGWPLRVLVVAGRNQTVSAYPRDFTPQRVYSFDQLWGRYEQARQSSEQVLVGAGVRADADGGADRPTGGVPGSDQGQAGGADREGGNAGAGTGSGELDSGAGRGAGGSGQRGGAGGTPAGADGSRKQGQGGRAGSGSAGAAGGSEGSGGESGGSDPRGISDLSEDEIEALINGALGESSPTTGRGSGTTAGGAPASGGQRGGGTPAGGSRATGGRKGASGPAAPGKSILDEIDGMEDILKDLDALMGVGAGAATAGTPAGAAPDGKAPTGKKRGPRKPKEKAPEIADADNAKLDATPQALPAPVYKPAPYLDILAARDRESRDLARRTLEAWNNRNAKLDTNGEGDDSPMAHRRPDGFDERRYAELREVFARVWAKLTDVIADAGQRLVTFVGAIKQRYGAAVGPFIKAFVAEVRAEAAQIPTGKKPIIADEVDNDVQVVYRGRSGGDSSGIFVPREQKQALERSFERFESEFGDVDDFVRDRVGYASNEAMYKVLYGYQIDALALAIAEMERGNGFIIGDDTGVGKGRTGAALMAWAVNAGKIPIFFSYKSDLYSAMHSDLQDIGKGHLKYTVTNRNTSVSNSDDKVVFPGKTAAKATTDIKHIIEKGELPDGAQILFTTYSQLNQANERRAAIAKLVKEGKAVLIMDESHNAAGDSATGKYFMSLLTGHGIFGEDSDGNPKPPPEDWQPPMTTYLSATFAKRPDNMPVYVRTNLRHVANSPEELVSMFKGGGDVLQQVASSMLVEAGSMIRRERSYAGVQFDYEVDEENAPRDAREVDKVTDVLRQIVNADRAFEEWSKTEDGIKTLETFIPPGWEVAFTGQNADGSMNHAQFTSIVHNYVGQLLLATKVDRAAEMVADSMNRGEKVVLALQNTMESALDDYSELAGLKVGDSMAGYGWQSVLSRGLTSAHRVTYKAGTGKNAPSKRVIIPINALPPMVMAEFTRAQSLIDKFQSTLTASPIDALRHKISQYWIVEDGGKVSVTKDKPNHPKARRLNVNEITGRGKVVDYGATGGPVLSTKKDPKNTTIIHGFQNGGVDVVILNSSGSTGVSLHASERAKDQRPRRMIILQPNPDIAVFKQTTGRTHRTGQVEWPAFTVFATGIPAERRQLAVLKKKIRSLFSNTSGGEGATQIDAVDFINAYGDVITARYLQENEAVAAFIGLDVPGDANSAGEDYALRASGRAALLKVDDQRDYFDTIEERYTQDIEVRNAMGTNTLLRVSKDLQASPITMTPLEEGVDESNPFTSSAYIGKYSVNVIGDIPTPDKVRAAIASSLNGRTPSEVIDALDQSLKTRFDEARNQIILAEKQNQDELSKPEITAKEAERLTDVIKRLQDQLKGFDARREKTLRLLRTFAIGHGFDLNIGDVEAKAVVVGIHVGKGSGNGNPFSPSNITISFIRNLPGGQPRIPLSILENQGGEVDGFAVQGSLVRSPNLDDMFVMRNIIGGREERYIATGNLLRARAILQGAGEIMRFSSQGSTEDAPLIEDGIQLPDNFSEKSIPSNTTFTMRNKDAAADYALGVAAKMFSVAVRNGSDYLDERVSKFVSATKVPLQLTDAQFDEILPGSYGSTLMHGPNMTWVLSLNRSINEFEFYMDRKALPRLFKSKELIKITGDLSSRRGSDVASATNGKWKRDPAAVAALVRLLSRFSSLVIPETGATHAREFSRQYYEATTTKPAAPSDGAPAARRADAGKMDEKSVRDLAGRILSKWRNAPNLVVVRSPKDPSVPAELRSALEEQDAGGAGGTPAGMYWRNTIYLFTGGLVDANDVVTTTLHEAVGHHGLRGVFGAELGNILDQIVNVRRSEVAQMAAYYGLDASTQRGARKAAEEVLAHMAQRDPTLGFVRRAIAAIRTWLRQKGVNLRVSDAEIIRDVILPARAWVEGAGVDGSMAGEPAMLRLHPSEQYRATAERATRVVMDFWKTPGRFNILHRTIGTQFHKAQVNPYFGRAFRADQQYLDDVTLFASQAAEKAQLVLPKLGSLRDVARAAPQLVREISALARRSESAHQQDVSAAAQAIFSGTLEYSRNLKGELQLEESPGAAGVVFTDEELSEVFGLTETQIAMYRQSREAIDTSLDILGVSSMKRHSQGKDLEDELREIYTRNYSMEQARDLLHTGIDAQISAAGVALTNAKQGLELAQPGTLAAAQFSNEVAKIEAQIQSLHDLRNDLTEMTNRIAGLKAKGYAPLMRFGKYAVTVWKRDEDGGGPDKSKAALHFEKFESRRAMNRAMRDLRQQYEADGESVVVEPTIVDEDFNEFFRGVTPEVLELFADTSGLEKGEAFQQYLKQVVSNRSGMKRLIQRKGRKGFESENLPRVLAAFVTSNARLASGNWHQQEMAAAVSDIPKEMGDVRAEARKLMQFVLNPQEEAPGLRATLFSWFIGGSVASAVVNMTQPIMQTMPYLAARVGTRRAAAAMATGFSGAARPESLGEELKHALRRAELDGIVAPNEIHQLYAEAMNALGGNRIIRAAATTWGSFFSLAEAFNRRSTFVAAYELASKMSAEELERNRALDAFDFAVSAVEATQGIYNRGNRPNMSRSAVGALVFTFKQFSINYVEMLSRLWNEKNPDGSVNWQSRRGALLALGLLVVAAGVGGLPFEEDIEDLVDTIGQSLGYATNTRRARDEFLRDTVGQMLGESAATFFAYGISAFLPLDVHGRLSLGNLIPGTSLLKKSDPGSADDVLEMVGPVGGLAKAAKAAWDNMTDGNLGRAALEMSPKAARDFYKGAIEMPAAGAYLDSRGRMVAQTDAVDAVIKALGFQPSEVAAEQRWANGVMATITLAKNVEAKIVEDWARGIIENDPQMVMAAKERLLQWNTDNPDTPIRVVPYQLRRRVNEANATRAERVLKSAPPELRPYLSRQLQ